MPKNNNNRILPASDQQIAPDPSMNQDLIRFDNIILRPTGKRIHNVCPEAEYDEYAGLNFQIGTLKMKFRKAKTTPKKNGLFVTLWRRNSEQQTEPFHESDDIDFYIVAAEQDDEYGFFIFPAKVLVKKHILSTQSKAGKRGTRVYPDWVSTASRQAQETQLWQVQHCINLKKADSWAPQQFDLLINKEAQDNS